MATSIQHLQAAIKQKNDDFTRNISSARSLIKEAKNLRNAINQEAHALEEKQTQLLAQKRKAEEDVASAAAKKRKIVLAPVKTKVRKFARPKKSKPKPMNPVDEALASMPKDYRSPRPNGILNKGNMCYANAVLQGFAATLDPDWLGPVLGDHASDCKVIEGFLSLLDQIKRGEKEAFCDPSKFQNAVAVIGDPIFGGMKQEDATEWLRQINEILAHGPSYTYGRNPPTGNPLIEALLRVNEGTTRQCRSCKNEDWINNDTGDWMLTMYEPRNVPNKTHSINDLLAIKAESEMLEDYKCEACHQMGSARTWHGLRNLPEILAFKFHRTDLTGEVNPETQALKEVKKDYKVEPEVALNLAEYSINDKTRTKYSLRAVVRHIGTDLKAGHYIAYVHHEGHKWWKCDDSRVRASSLNAALSGLLDKKGRLVNNGDIAIAFYQRDGVPPSSEPDSEPVEEEYVEEEYMEVEPAQPPTPPKPIFDEGDPNFDVAAVLKYVDNALQNVNRELQEVETPLPRIPRTSDVMQAPLQMTDVVFLGPRAHARHWYDPCWWFFSRLINMENWAAYGDDI
ncbi:cysteine proteinase [Lophiostoma macrostomum CBS 122681]|uniref:Ubiquitin carboxyl-terminal hydrolase n=1 Tax=Lophiostoma macrostomum CBS 122681 TaxID=1314788 RepID=A0A6A6SNH5_9PLEO|nr:cysteine proteinase [Lophiostoma macrostomum CBS 122681]